VLTDFCDPWSSGRSHNAYVSCARNNWSITTGIDQELADLTYELGQFGKYYLPATASQLINKGSRTPPEAGLYHYTTSVVPGSKDGTQQGGTPYVVDIGVHWVAVGASDPSKPADADGSSVPDYVEDRNGNGIYEPGADANVGETDWEAPFDIVANFPGIKQQGESGTEVAVPDTMGGVGPDHFIVLLNGNKSVAVLDKYSGARVSWPETTLRDFFTLNVQSYPPDRSLEGVHPRLGGVLDPQILYDIHSGRWIASAVESGGTPTGWNQNIILAISNTNSPIGNGNAGAQWVAQNWTKYLIPIVASTTMCDVDRDTLGVDANGIYLTSIDGSGNPGCSPGARVAALRKQQFINGAAPTVVMPYVFEVGQTWDPNDPEFISIVQPAVNFQSIAITDPAWFIFVKGQDLFYNRLEWPATPSGAPDWGFPTWQSLHITTPFRELRIAANDIDAPQFGRPDPSKNKIDIDGRLQTARITKINGDQYLWTCHAVGVNRNGTNASPPNQADRSAVAWYKIRLHDPVEIIGPESGRIYDSAADNPMHYYFPSIAVNNAGAMLLGFSGSSLNDYVGTFYAGRTSAGAAVVPRRYFSGKEYFGDPSHMLSRWGDYSSTSLDPDGITFWTIQEFAEERFDAGINAWGTRVVGVTP
jgi:hypothetical protein